MNVTELKLYCFLISTCSNHLNPDSLALSSKQLMTGLLMLTLRCMRSRSYPFWSLSEKTSSFLFMLAPALFQILYFFFLLPPPTLYNESCVFCSRLFRTAVLL